MDSVMKECAVSMLSRYANYDEKQLLSIGEVQPCIDSVLSRLKKINRLGSIANAIQIIAVITLSVWLSYRSAVRNDFSLLICFSPVVLLQVWRLSFYSINYWNWRSIMEIEVISELWRRYDLPTQAKNDQSGNATGIALGCPES